MYCGDEVGAIVGDIGYSNARFGFAGEDIPKCIFSSQVCLNSDINYLVVALSLLPFAFIKGGKG